MVIYYAITWCFFSRHFQDERAQGQEKSRQGSKGPRNCVWGVRRLRPQLVVLSNELVQAIAKGNILFLPLSCTSVFCVFNQEKIYITGGSSDEFHSSNANSSSHDSRGPLGSRHIGMRGHWYGQNCGLHAADLGEIAVQAVGRAGGFASPRSRSHAWVGRASLSGDKATRPIHQRRGWTVRWWFGRENPGNCIEEKSRHHHCDAR